MTTKTVEPAIEAPQERRSPMKLSEAMRIGSMNTTQSFESWTGDEDDSGKATMCAISTAWYALTGERDNDGSASALHDLLKRTMVPHPVEDHATNTYSVAEVIVNLNDSYQWTRPRIADWLESVGL